MPRTLITLSPQRESGKPYMIYVEMSGEDLRAALTGAGTLVALPAGESKTVYVNPAHVVMAQEQGERTEPMAARV